MITPALELLILSTLRDGGAAMTPERALHSAVNAASLTPVTRSDLTGALVALEERRQVIGVGTDDGTKWKLAAAGQARLAEANQ